MSVSDFIINLLKTVVAILQKPANRFVNQSMSNQLTVFYMMATLAFTGLGFTAELIF